MLQKLLSHVLGQQLLLLTVSYRTFIIDKSLLLTALP